MGLPLDYTAVNVTSNTGFVAFSIASETTRIAGYRVNGQLVAIESNTTSYLKKDNVEIVPFFFEDFITQEPIDEELVSPNHSPFDGSTTQSSGEYFLKFWPPLKHDGMSFFESHHPDSEGATAECVLSVPRAWAALVQGNGLAYGALRGSGGLFKVARLRLDYVTAP